MLMPSQEYYTAWGPLFKALRGGCWWLASEPVRCEASTASNGVTLNAFTLGGKTCS